MLNKTYQYIKTSVTPFDILISRLSSKNNEKIKVGWCSVFPPSPNGVAVANYFLLNKLLKRKEIEIYAIPFGGRIDKKRFPGIRFAKVDSPYLDVIIFFCMGVHLEHLMKKTKTKTIVWQTLHENLSGESMFKDAELKVLRQSKKSDLLIGLSKWSAEEYRRYGAKNAAYVPIGIDTTLFKENKKKHKGFNVLFVSRAFYYKGIIPFLRCIPLVLKRYPHVAFKLHGPIDENSDHLDEIISSINETKKRYPDNFFDITRWVDYDEMNNIYDGMDVLVFPSYTEGFGIPLIEAMSKGIPSIVADKPSMNEIVKNNKTGFCIKYREGIERKFHGLKFPHPEDMAEKIIFLIENKEVLDSFRKNCRIRAKKDYGMQQCVDRIIMCIKKVVKKK